MLHASENIIGQIKEYIPETDSTQAELLRRTEHQSLPEGFLIHADVQTAGKGQGASVWQSEPGTNLLMSFILYPHVLKPDSVWRLSQMIAVTLIATAERYTDFEHLKIKWPNDILISGRKMAGVLIQNQLSAERVERSVIGIGWNINQTVFPLAEPSATFPPGSLKGNTGKDFSVYEILNVFCERANFFYEHLKGSSASYLENLYNESLYGYGRELNFRSGEEYFTGTIAGTLPDGRLIVKKAGKNLFFGAKEVAFV